jgi:hypothetical protein
MYQESMGYPKRILKENEEMMQKEKRRQKTHTSPKFKNEEYQ